MDDKTKVAFEWAINQNHQSVAASYAKVLAEYIELLGDIEKDYPNWSRKFPTIADAVTWHTKSQDAVIAKLRERVGGQSES